MEFVIQEHHAKRAGLHYDLRLELPYNPDRMESWALPKGIPLEKGIRRLAIKTADHPFEWREFEGEIPEGYGAGEVSIWDEGTYDLIEGSPKTRYIHLDGDRLGGYYYLRHWEGSKWLLWKR